VGVVDKSNPTAVAKVYALPLIGVEDDEIISLHSLLFLSRSSFVLHHIPFNIYESHTKRNLADRVCRRRQQDRKLALLVKGFFDAYQAFTHWIFICQGCSLHNKGVLPGLSVTGS
jgi:hypothetical protein